MSLTVRIYDFLESSALELGDKVFTAVLPGTKTIFASAFAFWIVWVIFDRFLMKRQVDYFVLIRGSITFVFVGLFLEGSAYYKEWFFEPFYTSASLLLKTILEISDVAGYPASIKGALQSLDAQIDKVIALTQAVGEDSSFYKIHIHALALILRLAFTFLSFLYLSFAVEFIYGLMIVTAFGPLIIACFGFKKTKSIGISALKLPLHGALTLVVATVTLSLLFEVIKSSIGQVPVDESGLTSEASQWVYTTGYDLLLLVVLLTGMFLLKSSQYVSSVIHTNIGSAANAMFALAGTMVSAPRALQQIKGQNLENKIKKEKLNQLRGD